MLFNSMSLKHQTKKNLLFSSLYMEGYAFCALGLNFNYRRCCCPDPRIQKVKLSTDLNCYSVYIWFTLNVQQALQVNQSTMNTKKYSNDLKIKIATLIHNGDTTVKELSKNLNLPEHIVRNLHQEGKHLAGLPLAGLPFRAKKITEHKKHAKSTRNYYKAPSEDVLARLMTTKHVVDHIVGNSSDEQVAEWVENNVAGSYTPKLSFKELAVFVTICLLALFAVSTIFINAIAINFAN